jgi:hypothetical protein
MVVHREGSVLMTLLERFRWGYGKVLGGVGEVFKSYII